MTTEWTLTFDCAHAAVQAAFWKAALGYVDAAPPEGFVSWNEWLRHFGVPEDEWDDGASIEDPDGVRPPISFLEVPEAKTAKNRIHLDIQAGGGRSVPWDTRWPRVTEVVDRLTAAGALSATAVNDIDGPDGRPDHVVMTDPEGNEFCVV